MVIQGAAAAVPRLKTKLRPLALALVLTLGTAACLPPAQAGGWPVFDVSNLMEMIVEKIGTIEQWGVDNQKQIEHLQQMIKGNDLAQLNSNLNNLTSWGELQSVYQDTMSRIYAAQALWQEYEKMADFFSSLKTTEAWMYCLQQDSSCNFDQYFELIDETIIAMSKNAVSNAQKMQSNLQQKANVLKQLQLEGQHAQGHADILDNLSKINAETSSSLLDLNSQSAQLVELISREQAGEAVSRQAALAREENFASKGSYQGEDHVSLTLPGSFLR